NHFLVNITEAQRTELNRFSTEHGITLGDYYPVVRGRLVTINDEALQQDASKEPRSEQRVGVGRELNLTWLQQIPANNQIEAGSWFSTDARAQVSVEAELAKRLKISLGDELAFSIGGQPVTATVSSIRKVD